MLLKIVAKILVIFWLAVIIIVYLTAGWKWALFILIGIILICIIPKR